MDSVPFQIHERLAKGGFELGRHGICRVLLKNNACYPWLVLVPEVDAETVELHGLSSADYAAVCESIRAASAFVAAHFDCTKVNVGAIGNVVRQLHVHVVGRVEDDPAWPGVVWGHSEKRPYAAAQVGPIRDAFLAATAR